MTEPEHLNDHHRDTLREIFQHPTSHNIEWRAVRSLLGAVGSVTEQHDGKLAITVGSQTEFFHPGGQKDVDVQTVVDLRHLLGTAGFGPE
ncbi:MAG TPA: hypothetical protein VMC83_26675 [Streptosporangiaceae bacterium]|nr:hypothetical protein [Streptosporangiaceae bacterium]